MKQIDVIVRNVDYLDVIVKKTYVDQIVIIVGRGNV